MIMNDFRTLCQNVAGDNQNVKVLKKIFLIKKVGLKAIKKLKEIKK